MAGALGVLVEWCEAHERAVRSNTAGLSWVSAALGALEGEVQK